MGMKITYLISIVDEENKLEDSAEYNDNESIIRISSADQEVVNNGSNN